ncbi:MAG: diguanylate cyclase [Acetivibrio sp.]
MKNSTIILPVVMTFILIAIYWYWIFELIDHLLKKPKITKILRIPLGCLNTLLIFAISGFVGGTMIPYVLAIMLLFIEFKIFYRDTVLRNLFCTTACVIHILVIRAITTGIFSLVSGISIFEISNNPLLYSYSVLATFLFLNIAVGLVLETMPLDQVRIVNEHREQQIFMVTWMSINIAYLLFSSSIAESPDSNIGMVENQIAAPCVVLIGTYIMLFFAIKTGKLLGYKEKNAELQLTVSKEQEYRSSITKDAILSYEFNLNQDLIIKGFEGAKDDSNNEICQYSNMVGFIARKFIYPEDIEEFAKYASPSNIITDFKKGKSERIVEYRWLQTDKEYIWCRAVTNLARDTESGDICGISYAKNIDSEKRRQLELQFKAERDSLTGLYNKGAIVKLVTEHLLFNHTHSTSAMFMIDVDNFKEVNDHLGHAYGDRVLCELGERLVHVFRNEDIVGRMGGDEYIVYVKSGATEERTEKKGEEICKKFRITYKDSKNNEVAISGSVGVAISPKDGITFEKLYTHADTALYAAKKSGKDNCQLYDGRSFGGYESNRR